MNMLSLMLAVTMTAETTNPVNSFFAKDAPAEAVFSVSEIPAGKTLQLKTWLCDETDRKVADLPPVAVTGDADGNWKGSVKLPTERYGFYRLIADLDGAKLPKVGSCRAGCLTFAVVVDPAKRKKYPEEECFWGFCGTGPDLMGWLGATHAYEASTPLAPDAVARLKKQGKEIPPRPAGTMGMSALSRTFGQFFTPEGLAYAKACGSKGIKLWTLLDTPEGERHYREAVKKYAQAAKEQLKGRRRLYEVLGEPDLTAPNAEAVVRQARVAWEVLSKEDPEGIVVAPVLSAFSAVGYHRRLFDLGIADYMNGFGIHHYNAFPPEKNGILNRIRALKSMIREKKGHDIPMFATEGGYSTKNDTAGEILQMEGLVREFMILIGEGFSMGLMFYPTDFGGDGNASGPNGDYGITYNLEILTRRFGPKKASPRPASAALSAASRFTEGHKATGCLEGCFGETMLGYSYADRDDDCVIALWDYGEGSTAVLPVGRDEIVVADIMGNERKVRTDKGNLTLKLDGRVQYVLRPDPKLWGRKGTMAAQMQAEAEKRNAAREASREAAYVSVSPKISSTGDLAILAEVANRRDTPVTVVVESQVGGLQRTRQRQGGPLEPRETRKFTVYLADHFRSAPFETVSIESAMTTKSGYAEVKSSKFNFFGGGGLGKTKGDDPFAKWKNPVYADVPGGTADLSAKVATAWSDKYLLFDILVTDDDFSPTVPGFMSWSGDAIQLGLAKAELEKSTSNMQTDWRFEAKSEMTFALTTEGPQVYRTATWNPGDLPAGRSASDKSGIVSPKDCPFEVTTEKVDGGTCVRYRMAIPWRFINRTSGERHDHARFALWFCDRDAGDKRSEHKLKLFELQDAAPKNFGYLIFK